MDQRTPLQRAHQHWADATRQDKGAAKRARGADKLEHSTECEDKKETLK